MSRLLDPPDVPSEALEFIIEEGFAADVHCGRCATAGWTVVVAHLQYDYFERRWALTYQGVRIHDTRRPVLMVCPMCQRTSGQQTLTGILRQYWARKPLVLR